MDEENSIVLEMGQVVDGVEINVRIYVDVQPIVDGKPQKGLAAKIWRVKCDNEGTEAVMLSKEAKEMLERQAMKIWMQQWEDGQVDLYT